MRSNILAAVAFLVAACSGGGSLEGGLYRDAESTYRLSPPSSQWEPVRFSDNDLAWAAPDTGHVIAVNAVCDEHGDPSLKVLTDHLLLGFEDRRVLERENFQLDGRGAMRTHVAAALDGVPVELELTLLKKDGCVYDLLYTAPRGAFASRVAEYRALVASFRTGSGR